MIPFPLQDEIFPPFRITRNDALLQLTTDRWDVMVYGESSLAREITRLAAHNDLRVALVSPNDFLSPSKLEGSIEPLAIRKTSTMRTGASSTAPSQSTARRTMAELLSARYDGAVTINHLSVVTLQKLPGSEFIVVCRDAFSGERLELRCGAIINESGAPIGRIVTEGALKSHRCITGGFWSGRTISEQDGVIRFVQSRFGKHTNDSVAARRTLADLLQAARDRRSLAAIGKLTLISEPLSAQIFSEFNDIAQNLGLDTKTIDRVFARFGNRIQHLSKLPAWQQPVRNDLLRGELQLAILTELPTTLEEAMTRLDIPLETLPLGLQDDLSELRALFQDLQHLDPL